MLVVILGAGLAVLMAWAIGVLVRRERRRLGTGPEAQPIEAAAARSIRDTRRRARALQHLGGAAGIGRLDDQDVKH